MLKFCFTSEYCELHFMVSTQPGCVLELFLWRDHPAVEPGLHEPSVRITLHPWGRIWRQMVSKVGLCIWSSYWRTTRDLGPEFKQVSQTDQTCCLYFVWFLVIWTCFSQSGASHCAACCSRCEDDVLAVCFTQRLHCGRRHLWTGDCLPAQKPWWQRNLIGEIKQQVGQMIKKLATARTNLISFNLLPLC